MKNKFRASLVAGVAACAFSVSAHAAPSVSPYAVLFADPFTTFRSIVTSVPIDPVASNTLTAGTPDTIPGNPDPAVVEDFEGETVPTLPGLTNTGGSVAPAGSQKNTTTENQTVDTKFSDSGLATDVFGPDFGGSTQVIIGTYSAGATTSEEQSRTSTTYSIPYLSGFEVNSPAEVSEWTTDDTVVSDVNLQLTASTAVTGMGSVNVFTVGAPPSPTPLTSAATGDDETDNTAQLVGSIGLVTTGGTVYASGTGTATFDPETGKMSSSLDSLTGAAMTASGIYAFSADEEAVLYTAITALGVETTGVVEAPVINTALINGTGEGGALVLHGGTKSTTVTLDDSGFEVADSTNGVTFSVTNNGAATIANGLTVTAGGIDVNGGTIRNLANGSAASDAATFGQMQAADTALSNRISAEETARIAADTALGLRITNETSERIAADKVLRNRIASGTATAIAMGGSVILPDVNFTLSGNVGFYEGAQAVAINGAARVAPNAYVTGSVGGGINKRGSVGGRVGFAVGF